MGLISQHCVEDDDDLAGAGGDDETLGLALCGEPAGEGREDGVAAYGRQGGHVEHGSEVIASPHDPGPSVGLAAAVVGWSEAAQAGGQWCAGCCYTGHMGGRRGG